MRRLLATASAGWRSNPIAIRQIPGGEGFCIAFIIAVSSMVCMVGASAWQKRHPLPMSYPRVVSSKPNKFQDQLPVWIVPTVKYRLDPPVQKAAINSTPDRVSLPWSCATIRHAVATLTERQIEQLARMYRLSKEQRASARRCLTEKRT